MSVARQIRPGWDLGYKAQGSNLKKGVAMVVGAAGQFAAIASAIGQGAWRGINLTVGSEPNSSADATLPDLVTAQKQGIAQALVPASSSASEGDQAWSDAAGKLIKRVAYSFSGFIYGQFDESFTAGSNDEWRGVELLPHYIEICRQVTASAPTTFPAATRYVAAPGVALASAQVALYRARFAGEKVRNMTCNLVTAPAGSDTVIFTLQKSSDNGGTWSDLTITATITGAAKTATDLTHVETLAAGDLLAVKAVSTATTAAQPTVTFDVT